MARGCAGAHHTAGTCPREGAYAQNTCCARGGGAFNDGTRVASYEEAVSFLDDCLQNMWDEGIVPGDKGHWMTMRSEAYTWASCGFAWDADGRFYANQDFGGGSHPKGLCSCTGSRGDDGCGGRCVACSESDTPPPCADSPRPTAYKDSQCTGQDIRLASSTKGNTCTCADHARLGSLPGCNNAAVNEACPVTCGSCPLYQGTCPGSAPGSRRFHR